MAVLNISWEIFPKFQNSFERLFKHFQGLLKTFPSICNEEPKYVPSLLHLVFGEAQSKSYIITINKKNPIFFFAGNMYLFEVGKETLGKN